MKKHYHLVAAHLSFINPKEGQPSTVPINVVSATPTQNVTGGDLAQAQKAIQLQFWERMAQHPNKDEILVLDVFILSVSYLGHMTAAMFSEGTGTDNATAAKVADATSDVQAAAKALN